MKVWYIKTNHIEWDKNGKSHEVPWALGKGGAKIPAKDLTYDWLWYNAFRSYNTVRRALGYLPHFKTDWTGMEIEAVSIPKMKYRYALYHCYEIAILDENGNRVGETSYAYGTRKYAEELARHEIELLNLEEEE